MSDRSETVHTELDALQLPPSAAERDAAKRAEAAVDTAVQGSAFVFTTRNLAEYEKAAAAAVLTTLRTEESNRAKHRARVERAPWRRSQRKVRNMEDFNKLGEQ